MRILFFGTPEFSVPALEAVAGRFEVALAIAQPDRPKGRGRALAAPPVKTAALARGIGCLQVESPNRPATMSALAALRADLFVVVAYGAILSPELLSTPRLGCINLHASLLPRYRGASPIQAAILDGRPETGASTMWMDEGLDTGDVILQRALAIGPDETAGELSARLAVDGAALLVETLDAIAAGAAPRTPQEQAHATVTKKIRKSHGDLNFAQSAAALHDRARAMTPWPGATALFDGEPVRFARTRVLPAAAAIAPAAPGTMLGPGPSGGIVIECGSGALEVLRLTPSGKPEMEAQAWWRGLRIQDGVAPRFTTPRSEEAS
ncbi:MAG: methionyl-tRNA formyltransferase [Candidatus Eisenbacteria bacterium]